MENINCKKYAHAWIIDIYQLGITNYELREGSCSFNNKLHEECKNDSYNRINYVINLKREEQYNSRNSYAFAVDVVGAYKQLTQNKEGFLC